MAKLNPLILLPLLSFLWLASGVVLAGRYYPGYDHLGQFMSELGASGTTHGAWVNLLVFAGAEVWVLLFVALAGRNFIGNGVALAGLLLLAVYAFLLLIAAFFPCDFECRPVEPTRSHLIHVSAGMSAYAAGLCGLFLISTGLRRDGRGAVSDRTAGLLVLAGAGLLAGTVLSQGYAGLFQRVLEGLLYLWMIRIGVALSRQAAQVDVTPDKRSADPGPTRRSTRQI
ncbi:DUF998 domain-containing protein [Roseibium sp.]|uniref:DUF998 domain-containing protein n=1 Tax=Roseibium sp. TaxID=1936156 RepID=UPI003BB13570